MGKHATYIALLRGINVSGQKIVSMEKLRSTLEKLGFENVKTYVQSGNVVFDASGGNAASLAGKIEKEIAAAFGFEVRTVVLTASELLKATKANPFRKNGLDSSKVALCFLSGVPGRTALKKLGEMDFGKDEFRSKGKILYLSCPNGFGRTKLTLTVIERVLELTGTSRNWNTVLKLCEMSGALD